MDANIEKATNIMKDTLTEQNIKIDKMKTLVETIQIKQKNISQQFVTFGADIETNSNFLTRLEDKLKDMRYRKLDR